MNSKPSVVCAETNSYVVTGRDWWIVAIVGVLAAGVLLANPVLAGSVNEEVHRAEAVHCLELRRLSGGYNVSDVEIRNTCNFDVEWNFTCSDADVEEDYPWEGVYGRVGADDCEKRGEIAFHAACEVPYQPQWTRPYGPWFTGVSGIGKRPVKRLRERARGSPDTSRQRRLLRNSTRIQTL